MESETSVDHYSVILGKIFSDLSKTTVSAQDFETKARAHEATYLEKINFDPLQANYWKDYNNFWELDQQEIHKLKNNGFVVSERLGTKSFGTAYLAIYNHDLPVFITADSMLHVWHKAYDGMLEDLEKSAFTEMIYKILQAIHTALPKTSNNTLLFQAIKDIEYFILVALNLLISDQIYKEEENRWRKEEPRTPPTPSSPEVGVNIENTIKAIKNMEMQKFTLFGRERDMDFSQFKPRGHYDKSVKLRRYFMCMMWLGRIDLRIAGGEEGDSDLLELGISLFLNNIFSKLPEFEVWKVFDKIMQTLVGSTDSLTFRDLNDFVVTSGIPSNIEEIFTEEKLQEIQKVIEKTNLGNQSITSHVYEKEVGTGTRKIPRAFTFLGQRYTMDSWVLGQLVFPNIQMRPIPSCVDVGYTVFGNNTCAPILNDRMKNQSGIKFRDGISFQSEISALRGTLDMLPENIWHDNLYTLWLKAIRCLSNASGNQNAKKFPQIMRTKMWAQKDLETQFASWSQLRHDTVLYAKQSYSGSMTRCDYPAGFVDPRVEFWDVLVEMGERVKEISALIHRDNYFQGEDWSMRWLKATKTLRILAQKELDQQPFSETESAWIKKTIHKYYRSGSGAGWQWDGWYCQLFWEGAKTSETFEPIVADVHTAPPSPDFGFPGTVLTEGVGSVNLMVAAVDNGNNLTMYAGPVFSHFEIIPDGILRFSDSEWERVVTDGPGGKDGNMLNYPEWAREYLVTSRPQVGIDPRVNSDKFVDF